MKLVAKLPRAELAKRDFVRVTYPPFDVLVTTVQGRPYAIEDACNHAGASLSEGERTEDDCVACPMHGYLFDLRTGKLVIPRGLCDDQRRFVAIDEGDDVAIYDPAAITIV